MSDGYGLAYLNFFNDDEISPASPAIGDLEPFWDISERKWKKKAVGVGGYAIARQSADVTATENTTLANLTGLVHTVVPGTYKIKVALQALSTGNGGTKVAFNYTAPTSIQLEAKAFTASAVAVTRFTTTTDAASIVAATVANICIELEGTIVVAAGGTIQVQGAQNASHVDTTTYYAGSTFEITRIA